MTRFDAYETLENAEQVGEFYNKTKKFKLMYEDTVKYFLFLGLESIHPKPRNKKSRDEILHEPHKMLKKTEQVGQFLQHKYSHVIISKKFLHLSKLT